MSAAFIAPISKIFVIKVAILQLESVRYQQTQSIGTQAPQTQNTWCMRQLVYIENYMHEKITNCKDV